MGEKILEEKRVSRVLDKIHLQKEMGRLLEGDRAAHLKYSRNDAEGHVLLDKGNRYQDKDGGNHADGKGEAG